MLDPIHSHAFMCPLKKRRRLEQVVILPLAALQINAARPVSSDRWDFGRANLAWHSKPLRATR